MTSRTKGRKTPEGIVLDSVIEWLKWQPGVRFWRNSPGKLRGYTTARRGEPDLMGYVIGSATLFGIEIKAADGVVSEDQERWLAQARLDGVPCGVARSVADAAEIVGEAVGRWAP